MAETTSSKTYQHGRCNCNDSSEAHEADFCGGPAAFKVLRNGKSLRVCTLCFHDTDTLQEMIVNGSTKIGYYFDHDPAGALLLSISILATERINLLVSVGVPLDVAMNVAIKSVKNLSFMNPKFDGKVN